MMVSSLRFSSWVPFEFTFLYLFVYSLLPFFGLSFPEIFMSSAGLVSERVSTLVGLVFQNRILPSYNIMESFRRKKKSKLI
ncbi:unnamed protein product [Arabidopsis halleri]